MNTKNELFQTQGAAVDTPAVQIADYAEDQLIRVYVYEQANKERGKIEVTKQGYSIVTIQNVQHSQEESSNILMEDENGDLYFEYLAEIGYGGELLKTSKNNLSSLRFVNNESFRGITNNFVVNEGDTPKLCTINEPFDYDAYMKGEQGVYYMEVAPNIDYTHKDVANVTSNETTLMTDTILTDITLKNVTDWETKLGRLVFILGGIAVFEPKVQIIKYENMDAIDFIDQADTQRLRWSLEANENIPHLLWNENFGTQNHIDLDKSIDVLDGYDHLDEYKRLIKYGEKIVNNDKTWNDDSGYAEALYRTIYTIFHSTGNLMLKIILNKIISPVPNRIIVDRHAYTSLNDDAVIGRDRSIPTLKQMTLYYPKATTNQRRVYLSKRIDWINSDLQVHPDYLVIGDTIVNDYHKYKLPTNINKDNIIGTISGTTFITETSGIKSKYTWHDVKNNTATDNTKTISVDILTFEQWIYDGYVKDVIKTAQSIAFSNSTTGEWVAYTIDANGGVTKITDNTKIIYSGMIETHLGNTSRIEKITSNKDGSNIKIYTSNVDFITVPGNIKDFIDVSINNVFARGMMDNDDFMIKVRMKHDKIHYFRRIVGQANGHYKAREVTTDLSIVLYDHRRMYNDMTDTYFVFPEYTLYLKSFDKFSKHKYNYMTTNNKVVWTNDSAAVGNQIGELGPFTTHFKVINEQVNDDDTQLVPPHSIRVGSGKLTPIIDADTSLTDINTINAAKQNTLTLPTGMYPGIYLETESNTMISKITGKGLVGDKLQPMDLDFKTNELMCPIMAKITDTQDKVTVTLPWFNRESTPAYFNIVDYVDNDDSKSILTLDKFLSKKEDRELIYDMMLISYLVKTKFKSLPVELTGTATGHIKANIRLGYKADLKPALLGGIAAHSINDGLFADWQETLFLDDLDPRVVKMKQTINMLSRYINSQWAASGGANNFNSKSEPWYFELRNSTYTNSITTNGKDQDKDQWVLKVDADDGHGKLVPSHPDKMGIKLKSNYFTRDNNGHGLIGVPHIDLSSTRVLRGGGTHKLMSLPNVLTEQQLPIVQGMIDPQKDESLEYILYLPTQSMDAVKRLYLDSAKIKMKHKGKVTKRFNLPLEAYKKLSKDELDTAIKNYVYEKYGTKQVRIINSGTPVIKTKVVKIDNKVSKKRRGYPKWLTDGTGFEDFGWYVLMDVTMDNPQGLGYPRVWKPVNRAVAGSGSRYADHSTDLTDEELRNIVHNLHPEYPAEHVKILNTNSKSIGFNYEKYDTNYRWWTLDFQAEITQARYVDVEVELTGTFNDITDEDRALEYDKPQWLKYIQSLNRSNVEIFKAGKVKYTLYSGEDIKYISQIKCRMLFNDTVTIYLNSTKIELPAVNKDDERLTTMEILLF